AAATERLTVGFYGSAVSTLLPSVLRAFAEDHPSVDVSVRELLLDRIDDMLAGQVDVALHPPAAGPGRRRDRGDRARVPCRRSTFGASARRSRFDRIRRLTRRELHHQSSDGGRQSTGAMERDQPRNDARYVEVTDADPAV